MQRQEPRRGLSSSHKATFKEKRSEGGVDAAGLARCLPRNFMSNRFGNSKGAPLYSFFFAVNCRFMEN